MSSSAVFPPSLSHLSLSLSLPSTNSSLLRAITPTSPSYPIYHTASTQLLPSSIPITDKHLSLLVPVAAYWGLSLLFHAIDLARIPYFESKRIHESPEVLQRNKATVWEVIRAVLIQQFIQTILGLLWLESEETILQREVYKDHLREMRSLAPWVAKIGMVALGEGTGERVLRWIGKGGVAWVYWWGTPIGQLLLAFFIIDTWQYFLHRLFHTSRFLYRHFHSVHHRLYVPYAFGALYNHPVEGLLLDTLGAAIAHSVSGMTVRQAVLLFGLSTVKTVDDHCGYRLWWDPCQWVFVNNSDYHDIHHQAYGIKKNFSQPFFTNWDDLLGTRMTRDQVPERFRVKSHPEKSKDLKTE